MVIFNRLGNFPVSNDLLITYFSGLIYSFIKGFSITEGILSQPGLLLLIPESMVVISYSVTYGITILFLESADIYDIGLTGAYAGFLRGGAQL